MQENIVAKIKGGIVEAMKAKDAVRLDTLRALSAAFTNELVASGKTPQDVLSDDMAQTVMMRLAKQRKDSIEQFTAGNRPELAEKESAELKILEVYLPQTVSREAIKTVAEAKKTELGITDASGAGKLMGAVIKEFAGTADGADVKAVVTELLG